MTLMNPSQNPNCKIFTFQLIVDLLNDFGADLSIIGHLESNEDEMEIDVVSTDWDWYVSM